MNEQPPSYSESRCISYVTQIPTTSIIKPVVGTCVTYNSKLAIVESHTQNENCSMREFFSDVIVGESQLTLKDPKYKFFRCKDNFTYSNINYQDATSAAQIRRDVDRATQNDIDLLVEHIFCGIKRTYCQGQIGYDIHGNIEKHVPKIKERLSLVFKEFGGQDLTFKYTGQGVSMTWTP